MGKLKKTTFGRYLFRYRYLLPVFLSAVSTLTAVVATPLLCKLLVGTLVDVNAAALVMSTVQVSFCSGFAMGRSFGVGGLDS